MMLTTARTSSAKSIMHFSHHFEIVPCQMASTFGLPILGFKIVGLKGFGDSLS